MALHDLWTDITTKWFPQISIIGTGLSTRFLPPFLYFLNTEFFCNVTVATLGATLARHRSKPRVYIGCMKSGPVLAQK